MKLIMKTILLITLLAFIACEENEVLVTTENEIITENTDKIIVNNEHDEDK